MALQWQFIGFTPHRDEGDRFFHKNLGGCLFRFLNHAIFVPLRLFECAGELAILKYFKKLGFVSKHTIFWPIVMETDKSDSN